MQQLLIILFSAFMFTACSGENASTAKAPEAPQAVASSDTELKKQEACDVLTNEQVASLLKTTAEALSEEDMSFAENDRRSICHLIVKGEIASYNIRLAWQSEKAQENGALERNYTRYLSSGEENMKQYEELENANGIQILYGAETGRMGTNHLIRKRFGNSAEAKIEVLRENADPELKGALLEIIRGVK